MTIYYYYYYYYCFLPFFLKFSNFLGFYSQHPHFIVQVGDDIMVYLLKHTSTFLPRPHKMHHQVAGPPISDLCVGLSKHISDTECQKPSLTYLGNQDM